MLRIFLPLLSIAALLLAPDLALAGSCNGANGCAVLEHDATTNAQKTVNVDSTGAVLAGGSGSRVELLYSTSHTTADTNYNAIFAAFTPPAWVLRIQFVCRVRAIVLGPGATWGASVTLTDDNGFMTSSAGNPTTYAFSSITSPAVNNGFATSFGPGELNIAGALIPGFNIATYPLPLRPKIALYSKWTTAPTSWTLDCYCYGIGD